MNIHLAVTPSGRVVAVALVLDELLQVSAQVAEGLAKGLGLGRARLAPLGVGRQDDPGAGPAPAVPDRRHKTGKVSATAARCQIS